MAKKSKTVVTAKADTTTQKGSHTVGAFKSAYQNKLDAVHDLILALQARKTDTAADDASLNPTLISLGDEASNLEAAIEADDAPILSGPSAADATALQNAIAAAENVIAANAATNALIHAAVVLIGTLEVPAPAEA